MLFWTDEPVDWFIVGHYVLCSALNCAIELVIQINWLGCLHSTVKIQEYRGRICI